MANLKDIRNRMKSVRNTQQVTKAMKMVAAAKLRKAQDRMLQLRPYAGKLQEIIGNVVSAVDPEDIPSKLVENRPVNNILVILITSNRGLAGPFNTNIIKNTFHKLNELHGEALKNGQVQFLCMGRKGFEFVRKNKYPLIGENHDVFTGLSFEGVNKVVDMVFEAFEGGTVDKVYLAYNEFKNVMSQIRRMEPFLPLSVEALDSEVDENAAEAQYKAQYLYEPDREGILRDLIPKSLRTQVFQAVLESNASEHGARMVAMDTATENAEELLKELKISYNKARQASITKEILEISAGANALAAQ